MKFGALLFFAMCCCDPRAADFRREMQMKSVNSGMALGYIGGSGMMVIPFGAGISTPPNLENFSGPCGICPGWFSTDGRLIVWHQSWPYWKSPEPSLLVQTIAGETVATWSGQLNTIYAMALSPDRSRVAFEAINHYPKAPATGLQYVVLGAAARTVIEPQPPEEETGGSQSLGWSPDSRRIVFSRGGKIKVVDVKTLEQTVLASGSNPSWSPDGRWISFMSPDNRLMLLDSSTRKEVMPLGGRRITGPIAWSPDSCCISFSDHGRSIGDLLALSEDRMVVYRLSDGQWFPIVRFGLKGGTSARFGWLYNYQAFLNRNNANRANRQETGGPKP